MSSINFYRHGILSGEYSDYGKLTFPELTDLGTKCISPEIDIKKSENIIDRTQSLVIDIAYVSPQIRTHQSALLIWGTKLKLLWCLDEIYFDLAELMTEEEYILWGWLPSVRIALWKSFFERRKWIETPESVMERIWLLLSELENTSERDIIIVTHGFFLQMVRCFLIEWVDFTKISYDDFLKLGIKPIWYLEGFEIQR